MSAKKRALGRGLDNLLGSEVGLLQPSTPGERVLQIPIGQIRPNPFQPRRHIKPEALEELRASIEEKGILLPLVVRRRDDDTYELVAGERRWRAAQKARLSEVPAVSREFGDQEMLELALVENLQREALNAIEEAAAYHQLIDKFGLTQEQVADRVGKSRVAITNTLRLLRLPEKIKQWVAEERISAGHARTLLALDNEQLQMAMVREIMGRDLSVRETERRVRRLLKPLERPTKKQIAQITSETMDLQEKLSQHLGLMVKISPKSNTSGRVEVYYTSLDEFERLIDRFGFSTEQDEQQ